jgi:hypothetical protein
MNAETATTKDYIYCEDCKEFVDFWKYDHNLENAGHDGCKWRYVTEEELKECIASCIEWHCFEEQFVKQTVVIVGPQDDYGNIIQAS